MKAKQLSEKPPFELIEEAFHLVRLAPFPALAAYHLGSLPFVLAFLYFWSDMSRSAFADQRLIPGIVALTTLFTWMKCWQSVYCRQLLAHLCGEPAPSWNLRWLLRTAVFQTIVQPAGLFLIPIALVIMMPFGWTYAFFTSVTVLGGSPGPDLRSLLARAWRQMALWPLQNHYVLTLCFLFGIFVFLNLLSAVLGVPFLLKMLLGIESTFTRNPWAAMNATLLAALAGLAYLCLDPVVKAAFVLRCFYGESLQTAQDLRAELRALKSARRPMTTTLVSLVVWVLAFGIISPSAMGAPAAIPPPAPSPESLDQSIEQTIQKREYSWRLPRAAGEPAPKMDRNSWLATLGEYFAKGIKAVGRWIEDAIRWLRDKLQLDPGGTRSGTGFTSLIPPLLLLIIALVTGVLAWLLYRLWRDHRGPSGVVVAEAVPATPDLADENVSAAELPEDGWLQLARELWASGDLRLALRAFYLASLSHLGGRNLISLARFKSNRDYERELQRRAHALAGLPGIFADNVSVFERVWYGSHQATPEMIDQFSRNLERMKAHG